MDKDYPLKNVPINSRERPVRFTVCLSRLEYEQVVAASGKAGVGLAAYVRAMIFQGQLITRLTEEDKALFREMVSISKELNQLVKLARQQGMAEVLALFERYRDAVDPLLNRIKI
jgi:hypothetical protein